MKAYIDGVEIDKIPELREVCALDDWLGGLFRWLHDNGRKNFDAIVSLESISPDDARVLEIWIPEAPPMREVEDVASAFPRFQAGVSEPAFMVY